MAGYIPFSLVAPRLSVGRPPAPVVDRALLEPRLAPVDPAKVVYGGKARGLDPEMIARICEARQEGKSTRQIGRDFGITAARVWRYTKHLPPPPGGWPDGSRPGTISKTFAQRLYRCGFTLREIAEECGCSESWALRLVHDRPRHTRALRTPTARVAEGVADVFGISRRDLRRMPGEPRQKPAHIAQARAITYWLLRRNGASLNSIGKSLGGFDHTTVLNGCRRVDAVIAAHGLTLAAGPGTAARQLLNVEWRGGAS